MDTPINDNNNNNKNKPTNTRKHYFIQLTDEELDILEALAKKAIIESAKTRKPHNKPITKP